MTFDQQKYARNHYQLNKEIYKARTAERQRQIRAAWFEGKTCAYCGSSQNLELDHVDPDLKDPLLRRAPSALWTWAEARREAELAKCQALCSPCHKIKTREDRRKSHCPAGHEMTSENTSLRSNGRRHCKTCNRERARRRRAAS